MRLRGVVEEVGAEVEVEAEVGAVAVEEVDIGEF